jgi:hypothetical protein
MRVATAPRLGQHSSVMSDPVSPASSAIIGPASRM